MLSVGGQPHTLGVRRGDRWQSIIGATLLSLGLLAMLVFYWFAYGLGLKSGLIAAVAAPVLCLGLALDRRRPNAGLFAVGMTMGGGWIVMVLELG